MKRTNTALPLYLALWLAVITLPVLADDALVNLPARWADVIQAVAAPDLAGQSDAVRQALDDARLHVDTMLQADNTEAAELADAYGELGMLYHVYFLFRQAGDCYENAMALDPGEFRWAYYHAWLAASQGQTETGIQRYQQASRLKPGYLALDVRLANAWLEMNELEKAQAGYEKTKAATGLEAAALYGLGQIALLQRDYPAAIGFFTRALEIQPQASAIHYPLAQALRATGDREGAKQHLEQRGSLDPRIKDPQIDSLNAMKDNAAVHYIRGMKAIRLRKYDVAVKSFGKGLALDPDNIQARISYARALYLSDDHPGAEQALRDALAKDPDNSFALFLLGVIHDGNGKSAEAIRLYRQALQHDPGHTGANFYIGNQLYREGNYAGAGSHFATVIAADTRHLGARILYLASREHGGAPDQALKADLRKATSQLPEQPLFTLRLAQLLAASEDENLRDPEEALRLAQALVKQQPQPAHREVLALALAANGDFEQAASIQQALVGYAYMSVPDEVERLSRIQSLYEAGKLPAASDLDNLTIIKAPPVDVSGPFKNYPAAKPY